MVPTGADPRLARATSDEVALLERLRAGDEDAFASLIDRYHPTMVAVARTYVHTTAVAEEVAQEAWIGVLKGLGSFQGRSTLKTWIFSIVVNIAMRRGGREARSTPFSSLPGTGEGEAALDADRFRPPDGAFPGHWQAYPNDWTAVPEDVLLGRERIDVVKRAIDELPDAQRSVIAMRDLAGLSSEEVCEALDLEPTYQRVLLHRARSRVRAALEEAFDG